ncbi:hypothetical protein EDD18DRAFT_1358926 [Armillaria luteobubalina]|uniref:Uncharacterized protein n=1 Tax=Armillaria luteobubalina TaxID=153913 RepID=A0AA39PT73_9AGAR|nr:hypothetical protein EDD18DRAFT_1358926 [Armillaria luteobubalina]
MSSFEKALPVLLGILQSSQRSSLTLHSMVWKALVNAAMPFPLHHDNAVLELELELMKTIARSLPTSKSGDATTIDKPTDEMRGYILHKCLACWDFPFQMTTSTVSFAPDRPLILASITRMQQRLCETHASDRKLVIKTSLIIIECTILTSTLDWENREIIPILDMLYYLLSSKAFVVVGPDLRTLAHKIFMILDRYQYWMNDILPNLWFYSVAYQCYLHLPAVGGKSVENDMMPSILGYLISSSLNLPPAPLLYHATSKVHKLFLNLRQYALFSIDGLFQVMLLLIVEHNESVLYEWV